MYRREENGVATLEFRKIRGTQPADKGQSKFTMVLQNIGIDVVYVVEWAVVGTKSADMCEVQARNSLLPTYTKVCRVGHVLIDRIK